MKSKDEGGEIKDKSFAIGKKCQRKNKVVTLLLHDDTSMGVLTFENKKSRNIFIFDKEKHSKTPGKTIHQGPLCE